MSSSRPAERAELRDADTNARALAQRCFDRPVVLEAGAGTGKTTVLVARVLAYCIGTGWDRAAARLESEASDERIAAEVLGGVVAITFTEKAAAEMSQRIAQALRDVEKGDPPDWLLADVLPAETATSTARARALRAASDRLVVATIHAYCRRLLVANALDAGLHPDLRIDADGRLQAEIVRDVVERALETAYTESGDPAYSALAARGVGPRELETELLALLDDGAAASAFASDPAAPERIDAVCDRFRRALGDLDRHVSVLMSHSRIAADSALNVNETLARLTTDPPHSRADFVAFTRWLAESWSAGARKRVGEWARGSFNKGETRELGEASFDEIRAAAMSTHRVLEHLLQIDLDRTDLARAALVPLLAQVELALRREGIASFASLLRDTRSLLGGDPRGANRIRSGIDQLLVDEFQDTDSRQCDIIRSLALSGSNRPGLFLVGDPKQSIYGWRSADLAAYDAFVSDVLASGGILERLSVNYRSVPAILDEVERIIAPAMVEQPGLQPAFQPLIPSAATLALASSASDSPVEHWISAAWDADERRPRPTGSIEASEIEAEALACELRALRDRDAVPWASVGVLFRTRSDWEIYLSALRDADIPYAVEGDRNYYRRREIIDAASLLRSVLDPNDQLALLTLLRSPMVGVPDAALIPLWSRDLPERLSELDQPHPEALSSLARTIRSAVRDVPRDVPGIERIRGWEENLIGIATDIAVLRESFEKDPSDVFVEKLRTRSLFEATEAARLLGAWRCANLDRFFREISDALAVGGDAHARLRRLRSAVANEEAAEEGRPVEIVEDAVAVMTIHGAKGLDFDRVYLMQLHKGSTPPRSADSGATEIDGHTEFRLCGAPSLAWDRVREARERVEQAEQVRTLYVAMTRARHRLVLAGVHRSLQKSSRDRQPIAMIESQFDGDVAARFCEAAASGRAGYDGASGVRVSFPVFARGLASQPSLFPVRGVGLASEAQIALASARLAELRESAVARMQRPIGRAASGAEAAERVGAVTGGRSRDDARAIGTAVHRVLEEFDFGARGAELDDQWSLLRHAMELHLASIVEPERFESALAGGLEMLERIAGGALFARLTGLADAILARELPILLAPDVASAGACDGDAPDSADGPVGYFSGTIDLVYRDPESGEVVVADYKTDFVSSDAELAERVSAYREQGRVYQRALELGMQLDARPRFELWFFHADRIV